MKDSNRPNEMPLNNENGSIILIVVMVLALMTILGVSATTMSSDESIIVRNVGTYKQNLYMMEAVATEGIQKIMDMDLIDPATGLADLPADAQGPYSSVDLFPTGPGAHPHLWIRDKDDWTNTGKDTSWYSQWQAGPVLSATNSIVPDAINNGITWFNNRNEANASIRYAFVGWNVVTGYSEKIGKKTRKAGKLLAEYVSDDYGVMRIQLGFQRDFSSF